MISDFLVEFTQKQDLYSPVKEARLKQKIEIEIKLINRLVSGNLLKQDHACKLAIVKHF